ncbi:hypothetical protein HJFPF1_06844 [Paramyrothecium foliicola]|nr:hypothetical protein HJFPF1_06844 [Paramyrothecium foliicola]
MNQSPRQFSTAARVHPTPLPNFGQPRRMSSRWLMTITALTAAGYGAKVVVDRASERRRAHLQSIEDEAALQRRNEMLLDEYGDRSDLEALEKAVQFYEKKR